MRHISN